MSVKGTLQRAVLWAAFLLAHLFTAAVGWLYPSQPMGDVVLVYEPWSTSALSGGEIVGVSETWVYPQLALLPMLLAKTLSLPLLNVLGASSAYLIAWAIMVTVLDTVAFSVLIGRSSARPRSAAGWFWCVALLLLGPVGLYRIDAVVVALSVIAGSWLSRRPAATAAVLAIGAWIKIWPGAVLLAAVAAGHSRLRMLSAAAAVTAVVVAALFALGAREEIFGFVTEQTGRGLQIEAVAATPFLWLAVIGSARIEYSFDMLTFQIGASGADAVSAALTPVMMVVVFAIIAIGAIKAARGANPTRLLPPLALALVVALIAFNKVGSPQFQTWLFAPVILWVLLDRTRAQTPAVLVLVSAALTCAVYPLSYDALLGAQALPIVVLSARNILLVVLLALSIRSLLRVPLRSNSGSSDSLNR
ncbi:MAG: hypothetical protein QM630_04070 [Microbacterium sp.]